MVTQLITVNEAGLVTVEEAARLSQILPRWTRWRNTAIVAKGVGTAAMDKAAGWSQGPLLWTRLRDVRIWEVSSKRLQNAAGTP